MCIMTLFMQIAPCNSLGEPFPFNAVAEIIIGSFVVSEADAAAARHHYQQLKARMTRSSVIGNITNRCQQHCVALNQTGTSCVKKLQHTVVEAVEATMHADCRFQPPQVANLVRALTSMFFDTITVSDLGRISSTAYANAFMNGTSSPVSRTNPTLLLCPFFLLTSPTVHAHTIILARNRLQQHNVLRYP